MMPATASKPSPPTPAIRLATSRDGGMVSVLLTNAGFDLTGLPIDFNDLYPHWLVAEHEGRLVGCIQVALSKPIGYMELLAVDRTLPHPLQATLVKALCYGAMGTLKRYGATLVGGMVAFEEKNWKRVLKRRGAVVIASGNKFVKRL